MSSLRRFGRRAVFVRHGWLVLGTGDGLTPHNDVGPHRSLTSVRCVARRRPRTAAVTSEERDIAPSEICPAAVHFANDNEGTRNDHDRVDVHKRTHTLVAIDNQTGRQLHQRTVQATDAGHLDALRFARGLGDEEVLWAIEDCRHVSKRLEQALLGAGEQVLRVPPALTWTGRRGQREPGKSDPIDASDTPRCAPRSAAAQSPPQS
jgi:hypothetical protein